VCSFAPNVVHMMKIKGNKEEQEKEEKRVLEKKTDIPLNFYIVYFRKQ